MDEQDIIITPDNDETPLEEESTASVEPEESTESIESLKAEIEALRSAIRQRDEQQERLTRELGEFSELFPETPPSAIPEEIWEEVRRGIPLAAAFALREKKEQMRMAKIGEINKRNSQRSPGMAGVGTSGEYFTPDEVRAMSRGEVKANYEKIIASMKKWN